MLVNYTPYDFLIICTITHSDFLTFVFKTEDIDTRTKDYLAGIVYKCECMLPNGFISKWDTSLMGRN